MISSIQAGRNSARCRSSRTAQVPCSIEVRSLKRVPDLAKGVRHPAMTAALRPSHTWLICSPPIGCIRHSTPASYPSRVVSAKGVVVQIRRAESADLEPLAQLWAQSFPGRRTVEDRVAQLEAGIPYGGLESSWKIGRAHV